MSMTPNLSHLKAQLKQGNFDDDLRMQTRHLWKALSRVSDRGEHYYKAKSIVSEVSYYFDDIDLARESVKDFQDFDIRKCPLAKPGLVLEQIRCYLAHIQATLYYDHQYGKARIKIKQCINFLTDNLVRRNFRCSSTLAWANYQMGCCFRQLNLLEHAEQTFLRSIRFQGQRARKRMRPNRIATTGRARNHEQKQHQVNEEVLFCNRRIAIVLGLGLGFCEYTRGHLSSAREKLIIARSLIAPCNDRLNDAYLGVLLGSVVRCSAGNDPRRLKNAERIVLRARDDFVSLPHARYTARATYELALVHLGLADRDRCSADLFDGYLQRATEEANEVERLSRGLGDTRWVSNALVVKSRIERKLGHFEEAKDFANRALDEAGSQVLCKIDSRIARAESNISWAKSEAQGNRSRFGENAKDTRLSGSRIDLEEALKLNREDLPARSPESQNEKIDIVCKLHIARSYVLEGNHVQATAVLRELKGIKSIEHKRIIELWREVKAEIAQISQAFYVDWSADNLDYKGLTKELQSVLLSIAKQKYPNNRSQQARFLGLKSRNTLISLEKSLDKEP